MSTRPRQRRDEAERLAGLPSAHGRHRLRVPQSRPGRSRPARIGCAGTRTLRGPRADPARGALWKVVMPPSNPSGRRRSRMTVARTGSASAVQGYSFSLVAFRSNRLCGTNSGAFGACSRPAPSITAAKRRAFHDRRLLPPRRGAGSPNRPSKAGTAPGVADPAWFGGSLRHVAVPRRDRGDTASTSPTFAAV